MAIIKFNLQVIAKIKDTETGGIRECVHIRPLTTMHKKDSLLFKDLISTAVDEMVNEIEDEICDIEELVNYSYSII